MNLDEIIIERSPLQTAIHVETMRAELNDLGFEIISTEWLHNKLLAEKIQRKLETAE